MSSNVIVAIRVRTLDVPMKKAFGIAGGAQTIAANIVVEVELANGIVGYGEGAPFPAFNGETQAVALEGAERAASTLVGQSVEDVEDVVRSFDPAWPPSARCALECALYDAHAIDGAVSLAHLFGGAEEELVTDITITTGTESDAEAEARAFADFSTLKIKVGGRDVDHDIRRVLAVSRARPDARLILDANGGFSVDEAIALATTLRSHGVVPTYFEQPIAPGSWEALAEVRRRTNLPLALDESVTSVADAVLAKSHGAADAVNVKIMKSGITEAIAIVRAAKRLGLARMIGGMVETRLAMGMSACIAAGIGGFAVVDLDTPLFLAEDPWDGGYTLRGDRIDLRSIDVGHGMVPRGTSRVRPPVE